MAKHGIFNNPIAPRERRSPDQLYGKPKDTFKAGTKEEATTGRYMAAGDYYGTGFRQPVGKMRADSINNGPIPQKSKCEDPNSLA